MAEWWYRQLAVICEDIPNLQLDFLSYLLDYSETKEKGGGYYSLLILLPLSPTKQQQKTNPQQVVEINRKNLNEGFCFKCTTDVILNLEN